jgi:hypothetical protein
MGPVAGGLDESCWLAEAPWECEYFWDGGGSECGAEAVVLGDYLCCVCALLFFRVVVVSCINSWDCAAQNLSVDINPVPPASGNPMSVLNNLISSIAPPPSSLTKPHPHLAPSNPPPRTPSPRPAFFSTAFEIFALREAVKAVKCTRVGRIRAWTHPRAGGHG